MESDDESSFESLIERKKGWKRLQYVELWKRKKRKTKKDSGKAYETYNGELKNKKRLDHLLRCHWTFRCASKLPRSERERIFNDFYWLANYDSQNKYLYGLIEHKQKDHFAVFPKANTFVYRLHINSGNCIRVCKRTFCQVHGIGKRQVENLCLAMTSGVLSCSDDRGKYKNRPHAVSENLKAAYIILS